MKLYLDENLPASLIEPLRLIYFKHEFSACTLEGLNGIDDVPLIAELHARNFDAIITRDRNQLKNPEERQAIIDSGLRWIGLADKQLKGLELITVTVSSLIAGLRFVLEHERDLDDPMSYTVQNIPHALTQRVKIYPLHHRRLAGREGIGDVTASSRPTTEPPEIPSVTSRIAFPMGTGPINS